MTPRGGTLLWKAFRQGAPLQGRKAVAPSLQGVPWLQLHLYKGFVHATNCKNVIFNVLAVRLSRGIRWVLALAFDVLNAIFADQSEEFALAKPLFDCPFLPL